MAITTFDELKTAITTWTHRNDLTTVAADFVALAEAKFKRRIRHPRMQKRAQATVTDGWLALPTDFLDLVYLEVDSRKLLQFDYGELDDEFGDNTGQAVGYAIVDEQMRIAPYEATKTAEIVYYAELAALSDSNTSNWLLAEYPDLYLYACLIEAGNYLHDEVMVGKYSQFVVEGLERLRMDGSRRKGRAAVLLSEVPITSTRYDINRGY